LYGNVIENARYPRAPVENDCDKYVPSLFHFELRNSLSCYNVNRPHPLKESGLQHEILH